MPRFAMVVPNLNQSRFLPIALESIRHQSVPVRLAVMDGGSTDGFAEVLARYRDMVDYVQSCPDGGQAAAIRQGKAMVEGDIVCWLNADDYYFPGALDRVAAVFATHPDVDVIYGDAVHVTPDGVFICYFPAIQAFDPQLLPFSCFICQPACFVRRSAYDRAGGVDPDLKFTMDWDLWCRLAATGAAFQYLHEPLAAVRCYPQTKTLSGSRRRYEEIRRIGKIYGRRVIPFSWLGFYRYDLSFKQMKTPMETLMFKGLEWGRGIKKRLLGRTVEPLYGFWPWSNRVSGECRIQIPWYEDRENSCQSAIRMQVFPEIGPYRIEIGKGREVLYRAENGVLTLPFPALTSPCLEMRMACEKTRDWELRRFSIE